MYSARKAPHSHGGPTTPKTKTLRAARLKAQPVKPAGPLCGSKDSRFGFGWASIPLGVSFRAPWAGPLQTPLLFYVRCVLQCSLDCLRDLARFSFWMARSACNVPAPHSLHCEPWASFGFDCGLEARQIHLSRAKPLRES